MKENSYAFFRNIVGIGIYKGQGGNVLHLSLIRSAFRSGLFLLVLHLIAPAAMGQALYEASGTSSFGGPVGFSTMRIQDDGTTVTIHFNRGTNGFGTDDTFVIYLSTGADGRSSIGTEVNDRADKHRAAISWMGALSGIDLVFPGGFEATHAIAIDAGYAGLWSIPPSGTIGNSGLGFVKGSTYSFGVFNSFSFTFDWDEIGINAEDPKTFDFVATFLNPYGGGGDLGFASNEGYGGNFPLDNIGQSGFTFTSHLTYPTNVYSFGAFDRADDYPAISWNQYDNRGYGFGPWRLISDGNAGHFIGNPADAEISGMSTTSFGLFANTGLVDFSTADRPFATPLSVGSTFSVDWGVNWDSGQPDANKGISIYSAGQEIININIGNSSTITINGGTMFSVYGTQVMTLHFEYVSAGNLRVHGTGRNGTETYDQTIAVAGAPDAVRFYASGMTDNNVRRQPYFNNLRIEANPAGFPDNATLIVNGAKVLDVPLVVENLTLEEGSTFNIAPSGRLTVNGTITDNGGGSKSSPGLLIASDVTGTGSLIHNNAGVDAIVQYYMAQSMGDWPTKDATDWYYVSSPVVGQDITAFLDGYPGQYDLYRWGEAEALWLNYKADGGPPENSFEHTEFESGTGYLTAFQDERTHELDGELVVGNAVWTDLSFTPSAYGNNEDNAGWQLIGNPFASGVRFVSAPSGDQQWTGDDVELTPQYWDGSGYSVFTENDIIPSATSFFIRVTGETNSLTIPAAAREHVNGAPGKSSGNYIILAANPVESSLRQSSYVRVAPDAIDGFDNRYDSRFRPGYAPEFYSKRNGDKLLVQAVNKIQDELIIPFVFEKLEEHDSYVIQLERSIEGITPYLYDLKLEKEHTLSHDQPYFFSAEAGDAPNRFELRFSPLDDDDPVNVPETDPQDTLKLWFHNNTLFVDNASGDMELRLYDLAGRFLQSFRAGMGQQSFELQLSAGVYVVHSTGRTYGKPLKIVIQ